MSRLSNPGATAPLDVFYTNANPGGTYNYADPNFVTYAGMKFQSTDGRWFAIAQTAGTALAAGKTVAGPVSVANHTGLVTTAFTAYSTNGNVPASVTVTLGGTAVCANEYAGGYAIVATGTGIGQTLKIASNTVQATTTGSTTVTFENADGQNMVALDTTSTINLIKNPFGSQNGGTPTVPNYSTNGVVVTPTTASTRGEVIGAALYAIPASTSAFASYGLIQTSGFIALINDAGTTKSVDIMPSTNTAGAVMTYAGAVQRLGTAVETGTSTNAGLCYLQLP